MNELHSTRCEQPSQRYLTVVILQRQPRPETACVEYSIHLLVHGTIHTNLQSGLKGNTGVGVSSACQGCSQAHWRQKEDTLRRRKNHDPVSTHLWLHPLQLGSGAGTIGGHSGLG